MLKLMDKEMFRLLCSKISLFCEMKYIHIVRFKAVVMSFTSPRLLVYYSCYLILVFKYIHVYIFEKIHHNTILCSNTFLLTDEIACADPVKCKEFCENEAGCTNLAYPLLVLRVLPAGKQR